MSSVHDDAPVGPTDEQQAYIDGLREVADFMEAHPMLIPRCGMTFNVFAEDAEGMRSVTRGAGHWTKNTYGGWFALDRQVGVHTVSVNAARDNVCERRVVGTQTVEVRDPEIMKTVPLVTVEEDVVEWVCPPSLLAEGRS